MSSEINEESNVCRLCAQLPVKSVKLSKTEPDGKQLRSLINTYLPIKVSVSDGYPQILCPKCYRRVKQVVRFIHEWLKGQKEIRRLLHRSIYRKANDGEQVGVEMRPPEAKATRRVGKRSLPGSKLLVEASALTKTFVCKHCDVECPTSNKLTRHVRKYHKNDFECLICGKRFKHSTSLSCHKRTHHGPVQKLECNQCQMAFKHKVTLRRHQLTHSKKAKHFKFSCLQNDCFMKFRRKDALERHLATHEKEKAKISCLLCSKKLASYKTYHEHLKLHEGVNSFTCFHCGKIFAAKGNLAEHVRIHTGETPYHCHLCPSQFKTPSQLKTHLRIHSNKFEYACDTCGDTFRHLESLKTHRRGHTGEAPFACPVCSRRFSDKSNLFKHKKLHSGNQPYECQKCCRKFNDISNLRKHVKRATCHLLKNLAKPNKKQEHIHNDPDLAEIICLSYDSRDVDVNSFVVNQKQLNNGETKMVDLKGDNSRIVKYETDDGLVYEITSFPVGGNRPATSPHPSPMDEDGVPSSNSLSELDCLTRIADSSMVDGISDIDFMDDSLLLGSCIAKF